MDLLKRLDYIKNLKHGLQREELDKLILDLNDYILIDKIEYKNLYDESFLLACLDSAGVNNWTGYAYAIEDYKNGIGEDCE